jgi:hypothetical protein
MQFGFEKQISGKGHSALNVAAAPFRQLKRRTYGGSARQILHLRWELLKLSLIEQTSISRE